MISAINLRTEYLCNPLGIDIVSPRLFWNVLGAIKQTAYQVIAHHANGSLYWDTGKIISEKTHALYKGEYLQSRDCIYWQVVLWNENEEIGNLSESAWFEMGLLHQTDWNANWITADLMIDRKNRYPADYFQKKFALQPDIKCARLYTTACGLYYAQINGCPVTDDIFAPGYTDYRKRIQYQTYDVTQLLANDNCLDITLSDGWFRGNVNLGGPKHQYIYGKETKIRAQLEVFYGNDKHVVIGSDETFAWANDGFLRYADLKNGEIYQVDSVPSYSGKAKCVQCETPLTASNNVMPKKHEMFAANTIVSPKGKKIFDFGQNIAGIIEVNYCGKKNKTLTILLGEVLDHGEFTQSNFQMAHIEATQKVVIHLSGKSFQYSMKFAFAGFRYAYLVEQYEDFTNENICAAAVYSDMNVTGRFSCSNEKINQLVRNTLWSMKNNFLDVPTDCPTREKSPWTGDAQVFCETSCYFMNTAPFYRKWLKDIADRQTEDGLVHFIVPDPGDEGIAKGLNGSVGWADAAIIIPYTCWKMFGDERLLIDNYAMMKKYASFIIERAGKTPLLRKFKSNSYKKYTYDTHNHYGEWLEPKDIEDRESLFSLLFPRPEEATAYLHLCMNLMYEIACELDYRDDAKLFLEYAHGSKAAYNYLFVKNNEIQAKRQCKFVRPLAFALLDNPAKENAQQKLKKLVENRNYRIGTGFLSTPYVLSVLVEAGETETAFKLLENEHCPGWLYPVTQGATTIWESWEGYDKTGKPIESHDHYSLGAVCGWLFNTVGGVKIADENKFIIAPHIGGSLTYAKTEFQSVYGTVTTHWKILNHEFILNVIIPANCSAIVRLPNGHETKVPCGSHELKCKIQET